MNSEEKEKFYAFLKNPIKMKEFKEYLSELCDSEKKDLNTPKQEEVKIILREDGYYECSVDINENHGIIKYLKDLDAKKLFFNEFI